MRELPAQSIDREKSRRTLQRWRAPANPKRSLRRPTKALTRAEAAATIRVTRSESLAHADQSCRELALSLENATEQPVLVSPVTVWRYQ